MLAVVGVVAAVVVGDAGLGIDEAERRFGDLGRRGQSCSQRVMVVSCSSSCARLPQAFSTLGGCILTYAARCTRTCAVAVVVCPLRRARGVAICLDRLSYTTMLRETVTYTCVPYEWNLS